MPLSESHRSKLDSIVSQMETNGEAPESIQAVVEDYKGKYEGQAMAQALAAQPPSKPGSLRRGAGAFAKHSQFTAPFATGTLGNDFSNFFGEFSPRDILPDRIGAGVAEMIGGAIKAGREVVEPAAQAGMEAFERGDTLEGAARALQAGIGSIPFAAGALHAGEQLADPETRAEGVGAALGELSNVLLPLAAPKIKNYVQNKTFQLGEHLERSAPKVYAEAFDPKAKYEGLAKEVSKEGVKRGLRAGLFRGIKRLEKFTDKSKAQYGPEIETLVNQDPIPQISLKEAARGPLEKFGASESIQGRAQGQRGLAEAAAAELDRLPESVSAPEAWELIDIKRDPAVRRGAYLPGADPALGAALEAQTVAAEATSRALKEAVPQVAAPMKEYSFAANMKELIENRKLTGETTLNPTAAKSTLGLIDPYRIAKAIKQSPWWKTTSGVLRDRVSRLLNMGKAEEAARLAGLKIGPPKPPKAQTEPLGPPRPRQPLQDPPTELQLPQEQPLELDAYQEPVSPQMGAQSPSQPLPQIWGDEIPAAKAQRNSEMLLKAFEEAGWEPEPIAGLDPKLERRLSQADAKAAEVVLRTIQNPTYKNLPVRSGTVATKLRKNVLRDIFNRYRSQVLGQPPGGSNGS